MSTLRRFISHQLSTLTKVSHSESIHSLWPRAPQRGCACLLSDKVVCTYIYNRQPSLHIIHVHVHVHVLCTCTYTCTFQSLWSTHFSLTFHYIDTSLSHFPPPPLPSPSLSIIFTTHPSPQYTLPQMFSVQDSTTPYRDLNGYFHKVISDHKSKGTAFIVDMHLCLPHQLCLCVLKQDVQVGYPPQEVPDPNTLHHPPPPLLQDNYIKGGPGPKQTPLSSTHTSSVSSRDSSRIHLCLGRSGRFAGSYTTHQVLCNSYKTKEFPIPGKSGEGGNRERGSWQVVWEEMLHPD